MVMVVVVVGAVEVVRGLDGPVGEVRDVGGGQEGGFGEACGVKLFEGVLAVGVRVDERRGWGWGWGVGGCV